MSFDNPYFPQTFDVGTPGAGHMHFAQDGSQTLYGPDGITVLFSLDPVNGMRVFKGAVSGVFDVGNTAGAHIHFANDGSMTLYAGDGVTRELSIDSVNGLQVFTAGSSVDVAATLAATSSMSRLNLLTKNANEQTAPFARGVTFGGLGLLAQPALELNSGEFGSNLNPFTRIRLVGASADGTVAPELDLLTAGVMHLTAGGTDASWDGNTFRLPGTSSVWAAYGYFGPSQLFSGTALQVSAPDANNAAAMFQSGGNNSAIIVGRNPAGNPVFSIDPNGAIHSTNSTSALAMNAGVANGGPVQPELSMAYQGSDQYRHFITSVHDGATDSSNHIDFYLWHSSLAPATAPDRQVLSIRGDGSVVVPLGTLATHNLQIDSPVTAATATAGGVAAIPATVAGFLTINLGGTNRKIPFYVV